MGKNVRKTKEIKGGGLHTAQADAAYEAHVHDVPVTKASRPEIHPNLRRAH